MNAFWIILSVVALGVSQLIWRHGVGGILRRLVAALSGMPVPSRTTMAHWDTDWRTRRRGPWVYGTDRRPRYLRPDPAPGVDHAARDEHVSDKRKPSDTESVDIPHNAVQAIRLCTRLLPHEPHASEDHRGAFGCPGVDEPAHEVTCPSCGATIRARMADTPTVDPRAEAARRLSWDHRALLNRIIAVSLTNPASTRLEALDQLRVDARRALLEQETDR